MGAEPSETAHENLPFRTLVERCPEGFAVLSGGRYRYANPAWAELLGREGAGLAGRAIVEDLHPDERDPMTAWLARSGDPEHRHGLEYRFLRAGGEVVTLHVAPVPVGEGDLVGLVARDVSRLRQLHARLLLADRMMSVGAISAGVAHEINNPLSYVLGNLAVVAEDLEDLLPVIAPTKRADLLEALADARQGAERVRSIVRNLQAFARADHDTRVPLDLNRILEAAINMAWIEIRHRARLVKALEALPPVLGSEAGLGQLMLNLLLNAVHALPEGRADHNTIRVSTWADGGQVELEISDTGPGIPPELLGQVFGAFFTTKPVGVGTGLGLSIAHSLVTELGGTIRAESELGRGTTLRVRLPAARAVVDDEDDEPSGLPAASSARARVLVVDDEPLIASAMKRTLREELVTVVCSGREAIELLERNQGFDVIFCDLMMPEQTGMDVHEWLVARHPSLAQRMVFMTGGMFTPRVHEFLAGVENHRIEKPFELSVIRRYVREQMAARARTGSGTQAPRPRG